MKSKIGIVGCGNISGIYIDNLQRFEQTEVVACADLDTARARDVAASKQIPNSGSPEDLLSMPEVDIVVNLTVPKAHFQVGMAALEAGKHLYNEKPLTVERSDARRLLEKAREKGLRVGCAPDTFLGAGHQTCRKLVDEGVIGEPIGATAFMQCHGHESWHPSPEFYYEQGGGPMLDMGPYYLTTLINLIGGVSKVAGMSRMTFPTRTITSEPKKGKIVPVETPTHILGLLEFANGALAHITTSFDVWSSNHGCIEVYGSEGSMIVPDPNWFGGQIWIRTSKHSDWEEISHSHPYPENARGLGVLDMALSIAAGESHRANGDLAFHVLDVMHGIVEASQGARTITLESAVGKPQPMPTGGLG
ncbi:MAG TPA: Gfo/Idh/MocA family oxidoreductase [Fimbriimonadaceae bacterium]|nr:Gfo/Idh/MocA family oxidoreductase [Fimbriimonadaceae bacterium]